MSAIEAQSWSETTLVRRCVAGERLAWRHLHRRFHPVARSFLSRMGVGPRELDDACQDVFLRLVRSLASFRGEAELKTWLYRLCVTEAGRWRRKQRLARGLFQLVALHHPEPVAARHDGGDATARVLLERGLSRLKPRERAVFVMYELEGLSGKEIAGILSCPEATVYRRLHYARRSFSSAVLGEEGS